jgi:predicted DsbA family dithiol-disulfide isomerase
VAFPLHPETPAEGRSLQSLFAGKPVDIPELLRHLKQTANRLGLEFGDRTMTFNSRLAQELAKWAEEQGACDSFHRAVFRAYFVDGQNIASIPLLVDIARSVGLSGSEAEKVLRNRTFRSAVDKDWSRSLSLGITAVPTFRLNGGMLVGAQPETVLERFIKECRLTINGKPPESDQN